MKSLFLVATVTAWLATKLRVCALCAALASTAALVLAAPASAQTCAGDCNGDGSVAIGEIIRGVRIAVGDVPIDDCPAIDGDGNGTLSVNELIAAVGRGLQGCGGSVTATPTSTPVTPTPTSMPVPTTSDAAALAASVRVATDPFFRFFDFQTSLAAAQRRLSCRNAVQNRLHGLSGGRASPGRRPQPEIERYRRHRLPW